jgi:phosphate transport system permease protein
VSTKNQIWQRGREWLRKPKSRREFIDRLSSVLLLVVAIIVVVPFFAVVFDAIARGWQLLTPGFILTNPQNLWMDGGIKNAIVGSFYLVALACILAIPLSAGAAVYITEYARKGIIQRTVEFTADVLAGVPSIVFGAFGWTFFSWYLRFFTGGKSLLSGALTLSLMMIPTVLRTTQEALRAVPLSLREASLALGATRWGTTWRVTIRACFPAIVTGVLLAIARVAGETAPLLFTTGYNDDSPRSIFDAVASLPFTIYLYANHHELIVQQKAYTSSLVLISMVLAVSVVANIISRKIGTFVRRE